MYQWLGWVFLCAGGLIILLEVVRYLGKTSKKGKAGIPEGIIVELIKKLPWTVILGLILIYLGLYIIGVPVPFSVAIGGPTN